MSTAKMRPTIHIAKPSLDDQEWEAMREVIHSGWVTQGPKVAAFEKAFATFHDVPHALATTSCTTALHLILAALEIGPGDEVIVPSFTWIASANVVCQLGATPVLVDVLKDSYNIDPAAVKAAISAKTKAIMAVHLFGLLADMDALKSVAGEIPIVEDAACAVASRDLDGFSGSKGLAAAFSFHPRKTITTGEGGMVITHDEAFAQKMIAMRNHGASIPEEQRHIGPRPWMLPDFNMLGFNYRMTDMQGVMGLVQMEKLPNLLEERQQRAAFFSDALQDIAWLHTPRVPQGWFHGYQAYVCLVDEVKAPKTRNAIMEDLQNMGISCRAGTHAIHRQGYYRERFGFTDDDLPVANLLDRQTLAIPLHNQMVDADYKYVVACLHRL